MILVDTAVWISHFGHFNPLLASLLENDQVCTHEFIIEELACGHLKSRRETLSYLHTLVQAPLIDHDEFIYFVERHSFLGSGMGLIDLYLLASAQLMGCEIWSLDKALKKGADKLGLCYQFND